MLCRLICENGTELTFHVHFRTTQGIDERVAERRDKVTTSGLTVTVENSDGEAVKIYDITGRQLMSTTSKLSTTSLPTSGVYIVKVGNRAAQKIVVINN